MSFAPAFAAAVIVGNDRRNCSLAAKLVFVLWSKKKETAKLSARTKISQSLSLGGVAHRCKVAAERTPP